MAVTEMVQARKCGCINFHAIYGYPVDLNRVLLMCYLKPEADKLLEIGRKDAIEVLTGWLHCDAAYGKELMTLDFARELAEKFVREFADETSRFFTNGRCENGKPPQQHWHPFTESVFDGGVLIESGKGTFTPQHICIWFEDED